MKEYDLFVKQNGEAQLVCGGQPAFYASEGGIAMSVAKLWNVLAEAGERLVEIREIGIDKCSGEQTFRVKTLPSCEPPRRY